MVRCLSAKLLGRGVLFGIMVVGCSGSVGLQRLAFHHDYTITGTICKEYGGARYTKMACYSDTELIKYGEPDLDHGNYRMTLTLPDAERLRRFHIIDAGGMVTEFDFDRRLLKDSIINIDFNLRTLPKPYKVKMAITSHPNSRSYDTLWLDLDGRTVTRAYSDSVWRRVPLRDRRR